MKIAMITPFYQSEWGSHEHYLTQELARFGHEVFLITSKHPYPKYYPNYRKIILKNEKFGKVKVIRLSSYFEYRGFIFFKGLKRILKDLSPEVIHVHEHFEPYSLLSVILKNKIHASVVLTQHLYSYPRHKYIIPIFFFVDKIIGSYVLKNSNYVIVLSQAQKKFIYDRLKSKNIKIIPTGVDTDLFKNRKSKIKSFFPHKKIILSVTRFDHNKDVFTTLRAVALLKNKIDFKLIIIAKGPLKIKVLELINELDLKDFVVIKDYVSQKDIVDYYSAADVFVLSSISEVFGISVLEAMSCGCPVVCTNVGGLKDLVVDKENGYFFNPGEYNALAEKILIAIKNKKYLGKNSRDIVLNKFSWKKIVRKTVEVYDLSKK